MALSGRHTFAWDNNQYGQLCFGDALSNMDDVPDPTKVPFDNLSWNQVELLLPLLAHPRLYYTIMDGMTKENRKSHDLEFGKKMIWEKSISIATLH